jgi:aryl-alcohol dehydrogenase-like predicted oxidoreductase
MESVSMFEEVAMRRRSFLRTGSLAGGAALVGAHGLPRPLWAAPKEKTAQDVVTLGKTGIRVSRLFQGTGTNGVGKSSNQTRALGLQGVADLLRAGVDQGVTVWDLADQYGTHPHAHEALRTVPRDKVVIMTKTHARTEKEMRADLDRFRREIGTEMLDIVLLHCMMSADWPAERAGAMAVLAEAKAKGIIRAHGVSCHDFGALQAAAASDWVDVDLARLNPAGAIMDAPVGEVLPVLAEMKRRGKGVIGMKILGAGRLRDRVDDALQYALASPVLDCFTIGAESRPQLEDLLARIPKASVRG